MKPIPARSLALLLGAFAAGVAVAEPARLVADLGPAQAPAPGFPMLFVASLPGVELFAYDDGFSGSELWRTDGTAAGTYRVADLCPGRCPWMGFWPETVVATPRRVFFMAWDAAHGQELHVTDGTREGTRLVIDAEPGPAGGFYGGSVVGSGGELYFVLRPGGIDEIWRSDGERTLRILRRRPARSDGALALLGAVPSGVLFTADDEAHGQELWITDGTRKGARLLADLDPGPASGLSPYNVTALAHRGLVFFAASDGRLGNEMWRSDGTPRGTFMLRDIAAGQRSSFPTLPFAAGDFVYFQAWRTPDAGGVWRTDGTAAGTRPAREIFGFEADALTLRNSAFQLGSRLLFRHDGGRHGPELWSSGGTPATTRLLADLVPGPIGSGISPFVRLGRHAYFLVGNLEPIALWRTDGTPAGTERLIRSAGHNAGFAALSRLGSQLLLLHSDPLAPLSLWLGDGSVQGTRRFHDFPQPARSSEPDRLTSWRGRLAFVADDGEHGREVWTTDGGPAGTRLLAELVPGGPRAHDPQPGPEDLLPLGERLLARLPYPGELWSFDGAGGLARLAGRSHDLVRLGDRALFFDTIQEVDELVLFLWRTDGTQAGTQLVRELIRQPFYCENCGVPTGLPQAVTAVAAATRLFFFAPQQLWVSDGTAAGTAEIANARCGTADDVCWGLRASGDVAYFAHVAYGGPAAAELWVSDGTEAGTREVASFAERSISEIASLGGGRVLFVVTDKPDGDELWVSDGTAAGTQPLRDLRPGWGQSHPTSFTLVGDLAFFTADDGVHGRELWASDGTAEGTRLWLDVRPGPRTSFPRGLVALDRGLVFAADDGVHGLEPWLADGDGARLLADVLGGPGSSDPRQFAQVGDRLYFNAGRPRRGYELWSVTLPSVAP